MNTFWNRRRKNGKKKWEEKEINDRIIEDKIIRDIRARFEPEDDDNFKP